MSSIELPPDRPALMGILNVTPDSFSDGGLHFRAEDAIAAGERMLEEGADILDVGGESTRPGAAPVDVEEEIRRTAPVVKALADRGAVVSIDTRKHEVGRHALDLGAKMVNDVGGLRDPEMVKLCGERQCTVCIMHMLRTPETMQESPLYDDVLQDVKSYLMSQATSAEHHGIEKARVWIDPGIGFGKTADHNLRLLNELDQLVETGYPVLVGVSRKSFLGKIAGRNRILPADERLEATLAAQTLAQSKGARIIRAHDVLASRRAIDVTAAILNAR